MALIVYFSVLHEMKMTHTDLKPENMLFVNSDCNVTYNPRMVCIHIYSDLWLSFEWLCLFKSFSH